MLQQSYSHNYINIYLFQTLSVVLGFVSLFVVVPYISQNQAIYGIYAICISVTTFFAYADLGFLAAGVKYATECFAKNDKENEYKFMGFSHYILLVCMFLFSVVFVILSYNPALLISELDTPEKESVASQLFIILAIFAPFTVLQRLPQLILSMRVKQYIYQRVQIVGNTIKIGSVFYFFSYGNYDIVGYFLFSQIITVVCSVITCIQIKRLFHYDFKKLLIHFRFNKQLLKNTYVLALSSLVVTICWIVYYELDQIVIGKLLGTQSVAMYAIGFTLLTFIRTLLGILFTPFSARFNHFVSRNELVQLRNFYLHILVITFPLILIPTITLTFMAESFIISWVGLSYQSAVSVAKWLILCNIFAFVSYPAGILQYATEKIKSMYAVNIAMPILYWSGVFLSITYWNIESFAIFKFVVFCISGIFYLSLSLIFLKINFIDFSKRVCIPYLPAIGVLFLSLWGSRTLLYSHGWEGSLIANIFIIIFNIGFSFIFAVLFCKQLRNYAVSIFNSVFKK